MEPGNASSRDVDTLYSKTVLKWVSSHRCTGAEYKLYDRDDSCTDRFRTCRLARKRGIPRNYSTVDFAGQRSYVDRLSILSETELSGAATGVMSSIGEELASVREKISKVPYTELITCHPSLVQIKIRYNFTCTCRPEATMHDQH